MSKRFGGICIVAAVAALLGAASAHAERKLTCLPGTGLHCNGADPGTVPSRNQRIAAGLEAAPALANILAALIGLVDSAAPPANTIPDVIRARELGERVEACRVAAAWAASGARQLSAGDDVSAEAHFSAAVKRAIDGGCGDRQVYEQDLRLVIAQRRLKEALAAIGAHDYPTANQLLMQAAAAARFANHPELERQITDYRRQLYAQTGDPKKKFKERTSCVNVNGELMCD